MRRQHIGFRLIQAEVGAAVGKRYAIAFQGYAAAESHVVGLNIGDHVSFPVCRAEIHGAAFRRYAVGRKTRRIRDLPGAEGAVLGPQEIMEVDGHA